MALVIIYFFLKNKNKSSLLSLARGVWQGELGVLAASLGLLGLGLLGLARRHGSRLRTEQPKTGMGAPGSSTHGKRPAEHCCEHAMKRRKRRKRKEREKERGEGVCRREEDERA